MTYYLQTNGITWQVFLLSLASGLVVDGLLVVNNYRDVENDKRGGKVTLVVLLGKKTAENLYLWLGITAVALCQTMWMSGQILAAVLPFLFLVFHVFTWRKMKKIAVGKELNLVLGDTARNIFIFGLLVTIGLIIKV